MITLFTIPRAFIGEDKVRQENALGSWTCLVPCPEILLFCDDPGVAEAAKQFGCIHAPDIRCNEKGIPYVSHAFRLASQLASNDVLCYANADIIFLQDFIIAIETVIQNFEQSFLVVGQRWDTPIPERLKYTDDWQQRLQTRAKQRGFLDSTCAIDYFIYPRGTIVGMPDFLVGSPKWDNWLVSNAEKCGFQVISATKAITCIHQRHKHVWPAEGVQYNRRLWREFGCGVGHTYSGSWVLGSGAKLRPAKRKAGAAPNKVAVRPKLKPRFKSKPQPQPPGSTLPRPARVVPKDELGLPVNLNVPAHELVSSAKRLRRVEGKGSIPGKHSHVASETEALLAERARLQKIKDNLYAARIAARDARMAARRRERGK